MTQPGGTTLANTPADPDDEEPAAAAGAEETPETETETGTGTETRAEAGDGAGEPDAPRRAPWVRALVAVLVAALVAAGAVFFVQAQRLRDTPATSDRALTDTAATTRVVGDVSSALGKVFSYSPQSTAATKATAKQVLAGKALQQYAALFGQVERQAADQKLTLTSQVVRAGVSRLGTDSAHLLVFLDQVYEREGKTATTAAAQLSVTAHLRDGHWVIVDITTR
ncbi:hypothetical protein [Streptomyces nitrosporeus]|uniref:hypothetical protein n=1 Tax=Streptomyces nitrosporeus TaxID=28894 RepID=UPI003328674D